MEQYRKKQLEQAAASFRQAISTDGQHALAHYNLACTLELLRAAGKACTVEGGVHHVLRHLDLAMRDPERVQRAARDPDLALLRNTVAYWRLLGRDVERDAGELLRRVRWTLDAPDAAGVTLTFTPKEVRLDGPGKAKSRGTFQVTGRTVSGTLKPAWRGHERFEAELGPEGLVWTQPAGLRWRDRPKLPCDEVPALPSPPAEAVVSKPLPKSERYTVALRSLSTGEVKSLVTAGRAVPDFSWKPDGSALVYSEAHSQEAKGRLWYLPLSGNATQVLTGEVGALAWSPSGASLAVAVGRKLHLFRAGPDGLQEQVSHPVEVRGLTWEPGGERLAVLDPRSVLFWVNASSGALERKGQVKQELLELHFTTSGELRGRTEDAIGTVSAEGQWKPLTRKREDSTLAGVSGYVVQPLPGGELMLVAEYTEDGDPTQLYLAPVDGSRASKWLPPVSAAGMAIAFSPDGRWALYSAARSEFQEGALYLVRVGSNEPVRLDRGASFSLAFRPSPSPPPR